LDGQVHIYDVTEDSLVNQDVVEPDETLMGLEVYANENLYYSTTDTPALFVYDAEGSESTMYNNKVSPPIRFMSFYGKSIYAIVDEGVDGGSGETGVVMSIYLGTEGALMYGYK
jgi:hypothetical protein